MSDEILSTAILTADEAGDLLDLGETGDERALVLAFVNGLTAAIESFCGRHFRSRTTTDETFEGRGKNRYWLKNRPEVTSVTSVYYSHDRGDTWTEVPSASVFFSREGELYLDDGYGFPASFNSGKVTYVSGYKLPDETTPANANNLPDDVALAARIYLKHLWKAARTSGNLVASETFGNQTVQYRLEDIPLEAKEILKRYRQIGGF